MHSDNVKTRPWIVLVGGFLGAGKTTLLLAAARELEGRGLRSAVILNDQGDALVDSSMADREGLQFGEVTDGCFCCQFSKLLDVLDDLRAHAPDVIFAEPVGSCTDISATLLGPLREFGDNYQIAPFTVLVDPLRALNLMSNGADPHLSFLFRKQLEEADLVCFTKSDLHADAVVEMPTLPGQLVRQMSAKAGAGVAPWLDEVLSGTLKAGTKVLEIDYAEYARAEAALAWLNLSTSVTSHEPIPAALVLGPLLDGLDKAFTAAEIAIVHLKATATSAHGYLKAAMCRNGEQPVVEGPVDFSTSCTYDLLLNLRAVGDAETVNRIVAAEMAALPLDTGEMRVRCFHPAPPKPERRIPALP